MRIKTRRPLQTLAIVNAIAGATRMTADPGS